MDFLNRLLDAEIVGVISNHPKGGVYQKAQALGIPFEYWNGPHTPEGYRNLVKKYQAKWTMLSGYLKRVCGLDPAETVNIHPGSLPQFGGPGMCMDTMFMKP